MATVPPTIQLVHTSDAKQHVGQLKSVLMRMKADNRISGFAEHDVSIDPEAIFVANEGLHGVIVILTDGLVPLRNKVEHSLKDRVKEKTSIKLIEIIVDNLPYHNEFISLPQDLIPIRNRDNMDMIWTGIERDLQTIFPVQEIGKYEEPPPPPPQLKSFDKRKIWLTVLVVPPMIFFAYGTLAANEDDLRLIFFFIAAGLGLLLLVVWKKLPPVSVSPLKRQDTPLARNDTRPLRGIVKGFQQRFEIGRFNNKPRVVWTFRIDCYESGKVINTIPVQMVGQTFEGDINNGDEVEVLRWRKGTVLKTNRVKTGLRVLK